MVDTHYQIMITKTKYEITERENQIYQLLQRSTIALELEDAENKYIIILGIES